MRACLAKHARVPMATRITFLTTGAPALARPVPNRVGCAKQGGVEDVDVPPARMCSANLKPSVAFLSRLRIAPYPVREYFFSQKWRSSSTSEQRLHVSSGSGLPKRKQLTVGIPTLFVTADRVVSSGRSDRGSRAYGPGRFYSDLAETSPENRIAIGVDRYVRELRRLWWAKAAHELTWRAFCSQGQIASCIAQRASPRALARQVRYRCHSRSTFLRATRRTLTSTRSSGAQPWPPLAAPRLHSRFNTTPGTWTGISSCRPR
jgi:hypothetical protein